MIPELIVYNYCTEEISQDKAVGYIVELLRKLESHGIDTSFPFDSTKGNRFCDNSIADIRKFIIEARK